MEGRRDNHLQNVYEALQEIPQAMQLEYLDCLKNHPHLIDSESNPLTFLQREGFKPLAAALRLVMYWRKRKAIFDNKAYCALSLEPDGALEREDVELLNSGFLSVLPTTDAQGRSVLFCDGARLASFSPLEASLSRCLFFLALQLANGAANERQECVVIYLLKKSGLAPPFNLSRAPLDLLNVLPVQVSRLLLVQGDGVQMFEFLAEIVPRFLRSAGQVYGKLVSPIYGDTQQSVWRALNQQGFVAESLPLSLGGSWVPPATKTGPEVSNAAQGGTSTKVAATKSPHRDILEEETLTHSGCRLTEDKVKHFEQALERIPTVFKADFLRAAELDIINRESPFSWFLTGKDVNFDSAACALVRYWKSRKEVYGERAFNPMDLSKDGVLMDRDIDTIARGTVALLPTDSEGRPVICLDSTRSPDLQDDAQLRRIIFYALQVAAYEASSRARGVVLLQILPSTAPSRHNSNFSLAKLASCSTIIKVQSVHLVCISTEDSSNAGVMASAFQLVEESSASRTWIHLASSGPCMLERLSPFGLPPEHLPLSIGGEWNDYANFNKWKIESPTPTVGNFACGVDSGVDSSLNGRGKLARFEAKKEAVEDAGVTFFEETDATESKGLAELESAIKLLPDDVKLCLLTARQKCPELCEKESPPIRFLRYTKYDAWAAARRLANYWKERCSLFEERAFLPLNQTGEGALSRDDVVVIRSGYFAIAQNDKLGRSVLLVDTSRRGEISPTSRLRASFYFFSIVGENRKSQEEGFVVVCPANNSVDAVSSSLGRLIDEALPVRVHGFHVAYCPTVGQKTIVAATTRLLLIFLGFVVRDKVRVHIGKSKQDLALRLAEHGLEGKSVPNFLGGTWGYEELEEFHELRLRFEWELPSDARRRYLSGIPDYAVKPRSDLTEEERIERKRRLNVLNSRRKRGRVRIEVEVLQSQVLDLQAQQMRLRGECSRLEGLIQKANAVVQKANAVVDRIDTTSPIIPRTPSVRPISSNDTALVASSFPYSLAPGPSSLSAPQILFPGIHNYAIASNPVVSFPLTRNAGDGSRAQMLEQLQLAHMLGRSTGGADSLMSQQLLVSHLAQATSNMPSHESYLSAVQSMDLNVPPEDFRNLDRRYR